MAEFKEFFENVDVNSSIIGDYLSQTNLTALELANNYKKSKAEIYRILKSHGIQPNRLKRGHEQVKNLLGLGHSDNDIANYTGYTKRNIRYIKKKMRTE
jgi:hypothetical protein